MKTLKSFFSRTTGLISFILCTNHPWVKGIQVNPKAGLCFSPRIDKCKITKIHWRNLKNDLKIWRTTGSFSKSILNGIPVYSNRGPFYSLNWDNDFDCFYFIKPTCWSIHSFIETSLLVEAVHHMSLLCYTHISIILYQISTVNKKKGHPQYELQNSRFEETTAFKKASNLIISNFYII